MVCAIDCALKLFRREKLRNRSLELKLGQRPRLVLIHLTLRARRVANDADKHGSRVLAASRVFAVGVPPGPSACSASRRLAPLLFPSENNPAVKVARP